MAGCSTRCTVLVAYPHDPRHVRQLIAVIRRCLLRPPLGPLLPDEAEQGGVCVGILSVGGGGVSTLHLPLPTR
jgi:hypothetical protein